ncbi:hypothetical protein MUO71_01360 [Candidatus Bathyarchaeota archaeon]|nr:hypothetical protein [Candidatus Bathyarchaeota archaeon]
MKKLSLYMVCFVVFICVLFSAAAVYADVSVGVKQGDWVEYTVTCTGDVPADHNVTWAKIEVTGVEGKKIDVAIASRFFDAHEETVTATLNLETGEIGDGFIIPANLNTGDTFLEKVEGTITISGVEEKTYANEKRDVVTAITPYTVFYWDQPTGFLVEATTTYTSFGIASKAEKTNMWQARTFGIDPIISIVLVALVIVTVLAFFLKHKMKK